MRQGFWPATMNVFAHRAARPGGRATQEQEIRTAVRSSGSAHPLQNARARGGASSVVLPGIAAGRARSGSCVRQAGPRYRWEWPGRGPLPQGRAADRRGMPGAEPTGQPLLVRGQDAHAEVPGPGDYAEPGRAALQASQHGTERNGRQRINGHTGRAAVRRNGGDYPGAGGVLAKNCAQRIDSAARQAGLGSSHRRTSARNPCFCPCAGRELLARPENTSRQKIIGTADGAGRKSDGRGDSADIRAHGRGRGSQARQL